MTKGYEREADIPKTKPGKSGKKSVEEIAREVIMGKWGVNPERKTGLIKAGYNPTEVQAVVNKLLGK